MCRHVRCYTTQFSSTPTSLLHICSAQQAFFKNRQLDCSKSFRSVIMNCRVSVNSLVVFISFLGGASLVVFDWVVLSDVRGCQSVSISSIFVHVQFWEHLVQASLAGVCGCSAQTEQTKWSACIWLLCLNVIPAVFKWAISGVNIEGKQCKPGLVAFYCSSPFPLSFWWCDLRMYLGYGFGLEHCNDQDAAWRLEADGVNKW